LGVREEEEAGERVEGRGGSGGVGLKSLVKATYDLLGLMVFYTCGPKETR